MLWDICLKGFAKFSLDVLGAGRVQPDELSFSDFVICGKASVWLGESELSESAGFQGIFDSALFFVEGLCFKRDRRFVDYCILFNDKRRMVGFIFDVEGFVVRLSVSVVGSVGQVQRDGKEVNFSQIEIYRR